MIHDMYLFEVKKPEEVTKPWDYYRVVKKLPGEQSFNTLAESKCSFIK
jgi:branched-chain amino acid transport system substrate-binding protein